jgi:hypothetical protein
VFVTPLSSSFSAIRGMVQYVNVPDHRTPAGLAKAVFGRSTPVLVQDSYQTSAIKNVVAFDQPSQKQHFIDYPHELDRLFRHRKPEVILTKDDYQQFLAHPEAMPYAIVDVGSH